VWVDSSYTLEIGLAALIQVKPIFENWKDKSIVVKVFFVFA
jgi:hypothetical protein